MLAGCVIIYEQYFVALDETRVHLEKLGIPAEKITVSGIPIAPVFSEQKDKSEMRKKPVWPKIN